MGCPHTLLRLLEYLCKQEFWNKNKSTNLPLIFFFAMTSKKYDGNMTLNLSFPSTTSSIQIEEKHIHCKKYFFKKENFRRNAAFTYFITRK